MPDKTVLVVDDDQCILEMVVLVLEVAGYQVRTATDGSKGLEAVASSSPDLILLDVMMPVMDGPAFARAYHAKYDSRAPIVLLTASPDVSSLAKEVGAATYVRKPFNLQALVSAVASCIED